MALYGVSFVLTYTAWDSSAGAPKTGDVANHTLRWIKDGTAAAPTNSPSEVDATNAPGEYKVTLTTTEAEAIFGKLAGKSSTANVSIIPIAVAFEKLPNALPGADGGLPTVDANNRIAGVQGTITTLDGLDTAQDNQHSTTQSTLSSAASDITTILGKFAGITLLAQWLGLIAGKQTGNSTARTELRATGAGSGTFDETTDSLEAIRDTEPLGTAMRGTDGANTTAPDNSTISSISSALSTLAGKFTGITNVAQWLGALAGKQTPDATAQTEIRATGAGSGTYDATTDSQEAMRDTEPMGTAMRGTDGANTTAPDNATISSISSALSTLAGKFAGITLLAQWLGAIAGKQTANSTARTEIRATGAGSGTFDETTDSLEAIRDTEPLGTAMRGTDSAYTGTPPTAAQVRAEMDSNSTELAKVATILGKFTGITLLAQWLGALAGKQAGNATAVTEINATGAGSGTFDPTTDSGEAIRDSGGGGLTQQQVRDALKLAPSAGAPASGSTDDQITSISGSNTYEVDGSAVVQSDGTFRASVWLLLNKAKQDATTAPTVNLVRDDGTVVVANAAFTKAEQDGYTWLITKGSVAVSSQYNYELTVEFAGDSGPERSIPVRFV